MKNSKLMILLLVFITIFCVTGCGEKKERNDKVSNNASSKTSEVLENTTNSTTTSTTTTMTTNSTTTKKTTTKKMTTKKTTTTTKKTNVTLGKNEYISLKDNKVHKYTFTYPDEATCVKLGDNEPYDVVYPKRPYMVFGCEKVKDAKGNILWGEYFMETTDANSIFYY